MITKEVNKFLSLVPLMFPKLIDRDLAESPEFNEDSAIIYFNLPEALPIGNVMDMLDDDIDMHMLYHGKSKTNRNLHHCCFFSYPKFGQCMYKINFATNNYEYVEGLTVTIYESLDVWEDDLDSDLNAHAIAFDMIDGMTLKELLGVFCKFAYED